MHAFYKRYLLSHLQPLFRSLSCQSMQVFTSRPFDTIARFSDAYRQASNIRHLYEPSESTDVPFYFFDDYVIMDLFLQNRVRNQLTYYCEPCLLSMLEEDTKKSRQQLRILDEYLNCDRNYTNVAKRLDMHRNNVIYHIKNIEEQYCLNLDDAQTRLKLLIFFELLRSDAGTASRLLPQSTHSAEIS